MGGSTVHSAFIQGVLCICNGNDPVPGTMKARIMIVVIASLLIPSPITYNVPGAIFLRLQASTLL